MAFTLKVAHSRKFYSQADDAELLEVACHIHNEDDEMVDERILAYPLDIEADDLKMQLKKYIDNYNLEYTQKLADAKRSKESAQADKTIEAIEDLELT